MRSGGLPDAPESAAGVGSGVGAKRGGLALDLIGGELARLFPAPVTAIKELTSIQYLQLIVNLLRLFDIGIRKGSTTDFVNSKHNQIKKINAYEGMPGGWETTQ